MPMQTKFWMDYEGTKVFHVGDSKIYTYVTSHVAIDADGSPRAYHPADTGLDYLANAGYPHKGWRSVLVEDPERPGKAYVQLSGPNQGYFVCRTSLTDPTRSDTDTLKYVDSEQVPYIVFPGAFYAIKGTGMMGDLVMARRPSTSFESFAIVADGGPTKSPLGEISIKLAAALGGNSPNPRTGAGAPKGPIQYVVFPGSKSSPPWRREVDEMRQQAGALLSTIGGWPTM